MSVLAKGLNKGMGHDDEDSEDTLSEDFEDAEDSEEVSDGFDLRGGDSKTDGFSPLALSKWPGIFSDDVSWRLSEVPLVSDDDRFLLDDVWFYFSLLLILSFSSRPRCCCTFARGSLSCCSTGSSRP